MNHTGMNATTKLRYFKLNFHLILFDCEKQIENKSGNSKISKNFLFLIIC